MNMGRMCYVLCWALHTCRSTYEYGSYVLCVVLAPAYVQVDLLIWVVCVMCCVGPCIRAGRPMNMGRMCCVGPCIRAGRPMNMGRMCYVFEAPAVSRRVDL